MNVKEMYTKLAREAMPGTEEQKQWRTAFINSDVAEHFSYIEGEEIEIPAKVKDLMAKFSEPFLVATHIRFAFDVIEGVGNDVWNERGVDYYYDNTLCIAADEDDNLWVNEATLAYIINDTDHCLIDFRN